MTLSQLTPSQLRCQDENHCLVQRLTVADTLRSRTIGLLGKDVLPAGDGLWIKRCNSIHTFFMKFSIDALFVDKNLRIVKACHSLKPWRITPIYFRASSVFELPAGTIKQLEQEGCGLTPGKQLILTPSLSEKRGV